MGKGDFGGPNPQPKPGFKKTRVFKKKPNPLGFIGFLGCIGVFLDKQEKIGKIIQKLSNLKL